MLDLEKKTDQIKQQLQDKISENNELKRALNDLNHQNELNKKNVLNGQDRQKEMDK